MAGFISERDRYPVPELGFEDSELVRERLADQFAINLSDLILGKEKEKNLIILKFIKDSDLISYYHLDGVQYSVSYGNLKDKFIERVRKFMSNTYPPVSFSDHKLTTGSEKLPAELREFANKWVFRVSTNYPLIIPVSILNEQYWLEKPTPKDSLRKVEWWTGSKINFSDKMVF